uniref:Uncharacterized protein n=1 Tax=Rhizophora mucronata TaxID=61149 RepID=A0A2P2QG93_RHIMU
MVNFGNDKVTIIALIWRDNPFSS